MQEIAATRPSYPRAPQWRTRDFLLAVLGGFVGAFIGLAISFDTSATTQLAVSLVFQNVGHLGAVWWLARRRGATLADIGLVVEPIDGIFLSIGVALQIGLAVLFLPLAQLLGVDEATQEITQSVDPASPVAIQALLIVSVALLAPLAEELMFRGILYQIFEQRHGFRTAVFGSAAVFSTFHLLGLSTENFVAAAVITLPQLFIVGGILANVSRRRGRLGPGIFVHAGFNLIAILAVLYAPEVLGS